MELHAVNLALRVHEAAEQAVLALGGVHEGGWNRVDVIAVARPHRELFTGGDGAEHTLVALLDAHGGAAVLALVSGADLAAEEQCGQLRAVADAEDRDAELED